MHLEELSDALLLLLGRVEDLGAGSSVPGVHADVGQTAEERVRHNLEGQCRERCVGISGTLEDDFLVADVVSLDVRDVQRAGQVVNDGVQHRLHTTVLEGGATQNRVYLGVDGQLTDAGLQLGNSQLFALEVLLHQLFAGFSNGLHELCAVLFGLFLQVCGDRLDFVLGTHGHVTLGVAAPGECTHFEEVDDALEFALGTDRQLQNQRLGTQAVDDRVYGEVEVRTQLVHLVDEADTRHVVLIGLAPDGLGLRFNAFLAVENSDGAVEDAEGPLNLDSEVNVTRGVDDVDLVVVPVTRGSCGGNGDTPLLLLCHPVHRGRTVVGLTDLVIDTCVEQDALGCSRLAGIDVGHDADVADLVQVGKHVQCHGFSLFWFASVNGALSGLGPAARLRGLQGHGAACRRLG